MSLERRIEFTEVFIQCLCQSSERANRIIVMFQSVAAIFPFLEQEQVLAVSVIPQPCKFSVERIVGYPKLSHFPDPLCIALFFPAMIEHRVFSDAFDQASD